MLLFEDYFMKAYHLVMTLTETKTYKNTKTNKNKKCFKDPMYAIFFKSRGFKVLKYFIGCLLRVMAKANTQFYAFVRVNIYPQKKA